MTDRAHLPLDALRRAAAGQDQPGHEGADDGRQLGLVGQDGETEGEGQRRPPRACPPDRLCRVTAANSGGTSRRPRAVETTRKPMATTTIHSTLRTETVPSETIRVTTVRMTRPITSSATAAPRTVLASTEASARRSPKTRAVMPDAGGRQGGTDEQGLVARRGRRRSSAPMPPAKGTTTPTVATVSEAPDRRRGARPGPSPGRPAEEEDDAELAEDADDLVARPPAPAPTGR